MEYEYVGTVGAGDWLGPGSVQWAAGRGEGLAARLIGAAPLICVCLAFFPSLQHFYESLSFIWVYLYFSFLSLFLISCYFVSACGASNFFNASLSFYS